MQNKVARISGGKYQAHSVKQQSGSNHTLQLKSSQAKSVAQRRLQETINNSPRLQQINDQKQVVTGGLVQHKIAQKSVGPQSVVQRTIWRFKGSSWVKELPDDGDQTYISPEEYCEDEEIEPDEYDRYSQATGEYHSFADAQDRASGRAAGGKGGKMPQNYGGAFGKERADTAYGMLRPKVNGKRQKTQGPHMAAHSFKRSVFELASRMGLDVKTIIDSKLAPPPRAALTLMRDMLSGKGVVVEENCIYSWYYQYKSAYNDFVAQKSGSKKGNDAMRRVLEIHPLTTYRVGEQASNAESAAKGESTLKALGDIEKLLAQDRSLGLPDGLVSIDPGYKDESWSGGNQYREDFVFNYARLATGCPPSPNPYLEAPSSPVWTSDKSEDEDEE